MQALLIGGLTPYFGAERARAGLASAFHFSAVWSWIHEFDRRDGAEFGSSRGAGA
jgi:hypothetical protein